MKKHILFLLSGLIFNTINAQTCVLAGPSDLCINSVAGIQVGTGTYVNTHWDWGGPYNNWYQNTRSQFLYRASEMQSAGLFAGKITSLSFSIDSVFASMNQLPNFTINLGCTVFDILRNTTIAHPNPNLFYTGLNQVYTVATFSPTSGWNNHQFQSDFIWDGVSNLIVEVCMGGTSGYSLNAMANLEETTYRSGSSLYNDPIPVCSNPPSAQWSWVNPINFNTLKFLRPIIRFDNCTINSIGINEKQNNSVKIYPNPAREELNIETKENILSIELINAIGQLMMREEIKSISNSTTLKVKDCEEGIYLLKINTTSTTTLEKFLISK